MGLSINRQSQKPLPKGCREGLEKITSLFLDREGIDSRVEVSLCLVDDPQMRELNYLYRRRHSPTDVLSFPQGEGVPRESRKETREALDRGEEITLGDIVISLDRAGVQAREGGRSPAQEVYRLFIHGLLHLAGYTHQREEDYQLMEAKAGELVDLVKNY